MNNTAPLSVFQQIEDGLKDCLMHARGERELVERKASASLPNTMPRKIPRNLQVNTDDDTVDRR